MQRKVIADFPLVALALLLSIFGILMVYSAGQTDVPTVVARLCRSQIIWLAISTRRRAARHPRSPSGSSSGWRGRRTWSR